MPVTQIPEIPASIKSSRPLLGREADGHVAAIAYRIAVAGIARCEEPAAVTGALLQHLSQYEHGDRPGIAAAYGLDRGPGVVAVVADSPADRAGVRPGDVLLAVEGRPLPPEQGLAAGFDASLARTRSDAIDNILRTVPAQGVDVTLLRDGASIGVRLAPRPACPSIVHLARSAQINAYANGRHIFVTTGLLARIRNDHELAFVLAHEMAHNILGHAAIMRGPGVHRGLGRTFGRSGRVVRGTERAADALGGALMLDAGYDPVLGSMVLRRFSSNPFGIDLFEAHDSAAQRERAMRTLAEERKLTR